MSDVIAEEQMLEPEKFDLRSLDISKLQKEKLHSLFPEVFTDEGKIDFDKVRLTLGDTVDIAKERYGMHWPGKIDCFKAIQTPSIGTLVPIEKESVNFDQTQNLIIEGDNLEVLKLMQKAYIGKVKMIYIDPPYNTGNDFIYPDNYAESLETYLRYTGQLDNEGRKFYTNTDSDGRFHSKWLSMMFPRLFLARNLLREDGVVFVSIDDNEVHNLRLVMDELFGPENFIGTIVVQSNPRGRHLEKFIATSHEMIQVYAKNADCAVINKAALTAEQINEYDQTEPDGRKYRFLGLRKRGAFSRREERPNLHYPIYYNPETSYLDVDSHANWITIIPRLSDGHDGVWRWSREKVRRDRDQLICKRVRGRDEWDVFQKDYFDEEESGRKYKTIWFDKEVNYENGKDEIKELFGSAVFDTVKPLALIKRLVDLGDTEDGIALDFFAGSGTLAHAVLELNRQDGGTRNFILVQLPESTGRKDFVTIADITKERVRKVIHKLGEPQRDSSGQMKLEIENGIPSNNATQDLGFRVFKLTTSNFKVWDSSRPEHHEELATRLQEYIDHVVPGRSQEDILYELLLKSGYPLSTRLQCIKLADKQVFDVGEGQMLICLDPNLDIDAIRAIAQRKPIRVVCLDLAFHQNDQLKTNAVQTMKAHGVESFKTV